MRHWFPPEFGCRTFSILIRKLLFLPVGGVVAGRDGQKADKAAVAIGGCPPGVSDAQRINGIDARRWLDAGGSLPFQAIIPVGLFPSHSPQLVQRIENRDPFGFFSDREDSPGKLDC